MSNESPLILPFDGKAPRIAETAFVAPHATVIGDVEIGTESGIWFYALVRGDVHAIRIGQRTNVQDHTTLHVSHNKYPLLIGDDVTIGHGAIVHGCTLGNRVLIGMGAVVMDGAVIEDEVIIAAGALVPEGKRIPRGHLAIGRPAQVKRPLSAEELAFLPQSALHYARLGKTYREQVFRDSQKT